MRANLLRSSIASALAALGAAFTSSCSIATQPADTPLGDLPNYETFKSAKVSDFMEHRCGGLDCHGQEGRPLRIYGQWGLRLKAGEKGKRNTTATSEEERVENYRSVVGLEPENLAKCFASQGTNVETFQLLKKPLDISGFGIRHKGGPVLRAQESDAGWQCLFGWVSGKVDPADCAEGMKVK